MLATWGCSTFPKPTLSLDFAGATSLDDRITFTRGSQATLFDSTGTLKYAKHNLLLQSQTFQTTWSPSNTIVSTDAIAAPDGSLTGDKLIENTTASVQHRLDQTVTTASNQSYTYSIYVKAGETPTFVLQIVAIGSSSTTSSIGFNVTSGVIAWDNSLNGLVTSVSVTNVGNGWYRCALVYALNGTVTTHQVRVYPRNISTYTGDGTSGIYIWGAQLNFTNMEGGVTSSLTTYYPTTTAAYYAPRFDYNPSTLQPLGLLIEEQRTNLLTYSADFADAAWVKSSSTITSNTIVAPDGTLTADKLIPNNGITGAYAIQTTSITSGTTYTYTLYAKAAGFTQFRLLAQAGGFGSGVTNQLGIYDLSTGSASVAGGTPIVSMTSIGNGWYRCVMTVAATATTTDGIQIRIATAGDGTSGIYVWGAQLEAGAFATSYIPTTTTALTRNADVASMTGTNFSSWYSASEGTIYTESQLTRQAAAALTLVATINDNTGNNFLHNFYRATGNTGFQCTVSTAGQADLNNGVAITANTVAKIGSAYKASDFAMSTNAGTVQTDTSGTIPTVSQLQIGAGASGNSLNGYIRRLAFYPQRLPNTTLQALTS